MLDEWAKLPPDTIGSVFGSDWLSETDRVCLISTYAEDEWLRHRKSSRSGVADFCGFPAVAEGWVFRMASIPVY